jgi:hypothetical protein
MKSTKPTVILKSGKSKLVAAPDREKLAQLKQQIKDAILRLQSAKRAVREAKDGIEQAKLALKNAKKNSKPAKPIQPAKSTDTTTKPKPAVKKSVRKQATTAQPKAVAKRVAAKPVAARKKSTRAKSKVAAPASAVEVVSQVTATDNSDET